LYYIPSTCTTDGYSKINSRNTSSNWGDYKKQHNIDVIRSYVNYNRIEVDNTSGEECYRVMMGPKESEAWKILVNQGKKYISLESPQQSAIVKVTDGKVTLKSSGATVEVSGSNVKVTGTGSVNVNGSNINMTGTTKISGNTTMNGNTNVSGNATISGKTTMTSATVGGSPVVTEATVGAIVKKYIPDGIITSANISSYIPQ
jgi:phage gp45-like